VSRAKPKVTKPKRAETKAKRTTKRALPTAAAPVAAAAGTSSSALRIGGFLLVVLVLADSVLLAVSAKYLREAP
jgi:hypothetical protein